MSWAVTWRGFAEEIEKISAVSSPSIRAVPSPSGDGGQLKPTVTNPIPTSKIVGKALRSTNLQKTNYTTVNTRAQGPDISLTSEQKALQPPVVRS